jgi:rubrerythrin
LSRLVISKGLQGEKKEDWGMIGESGDIMQMLINHELTMKRLYEVFAGTFSGHKDLWTGLADDEQRHADMLGKIMYEPGVDEWVLQDNRLNPQVIKFSDRYIESQAEKAQFGKLSLKQALSIARDLEGALVEKQFSKISDLSSEELREPLISIAADTERHLKTVEEALDAEMLRHS